ncbi:MAG TPA: protein kinase [Gemmatimonadales bacterium]|nr:protein kinase [Gemmatimonadales bacterium]
MTELQDRLQQALGTAYRLERELGGGGMSRVFVAEETALGRKVVVKVLPPEYGAGLNVDRFRREIQVAAGLHHPHIVPLLAAGQAGDVLYYTMPLIEGESLRARLASRGELPVHDTVRLLRDVVDGLAFAHQHGVVHRDIKPDNVLISGKHALVTDFGVAKALEASGRSSITSTGLALGTPAYMAPEQAAADPHTDHRADLYAVGVLAYEMLTGSPPFTGPSAQSVLTAHVTKIPIPVTEARATVPAGLANIVMRCLEKKPADRFQSAEELLSQLELASTPSGGTVPTSATPAVTASQPSATATVASAAAPAWRRAGLLIVGAVVALSLAIAVPRFRGKSAAAPGGMTIVVLPFQNLGKPEDEYFADGITEEIINRLTGVSGLRVIPRSSAMQYKGTTKPLRRIGEELGAGYILEGTVRWDQLLDGTRQIRVSPEVIKVSDGTNVWAHGYQAVLAGVFQVQSDIAQQVTSALGVALAEPEKQELAEKPTENPEAYDYYLRGRAYYLRGYSKADIGAAIENFSKAVSADPGFAAAWAALSESHSEYFWFFFDRTPQRLVIAKAAADSALRLNPDLADAHRALGFYYYWGFLDYDRALQELNLALKKRANDPEVIFAIAAVNRRQGRWEDAITNFKKAVDLDPRSPLNSYNLGETYFLTRNYEDAKHFAERARDLSPDWNVPYALLARIALRWHGDTADAYTALRQGAARLGPDGLLALFGTVQGGRYEDAFLVAGDSALSRALAGSSPSTFNDSASYFVLKAEVAQQQNQVARSRSYLDSARVIREAALGGPSDEAGIHAELGRIYAGLGRRSDAIREGKRAVEMLPLSKEAYRGGTILNQLARIYLLTGDYDQAVDVLSQLLAVPSIVSVPELRVDPFWQPLAGNPKFEKLLASQPKIQ